MTWRNDGLIKRFDGTFSEPPEWELAQYGWAPNEPRNGKRGPKPGPIQHGTARGYAMHYSRGEKPCHLCKKARSLEDARQRRRARKAAA